jgi:hypothetical protein
MSRHSAERVRSAWAAPSSDGDLRSLIDWEALSRLGFDPAVELFAPGAGDPVFGSPCAGPLRATRWSTAVLGDAQNVHVGDVQRGCRRAGNSPVRRLPDGAWVDEVAAWWSVCRGVLGDGGAGG